MKTKTKPTPRARKMWANYYPDAGGFVCLHGTRTCAKDNAAEDCLNAAIPVAVIPLHDFEALVAKAKTEYVDACHMHVTIRGRVKYMLTAIVVLPRQRKGGRK